MHLIINQGIINENYHDVVIRLYSPAFFSLCSNRDGNRRYGADGRKKIRQQADRDYKITEARMGNKVHITAEKVLPE